ncbi:hypothetical protein [Nocardioides sp. 1609]|uniref:hypothetical protein n=1 Tax=Nocardioides sp. 1609 TaxID=2508327 RepID=UPI00107031D8|nr:hypothetical protein [Nocardioides sp. 1609]
MAEEDQETAKKQQDDRLALGVALGTPLGVVLSLLLDSWAMLGVGIALGLVWGALPSTKDRDPR